MTLIDAILKAAHEEGKHSSPPPELEEPDSSFKVKRAHKYAHVRARVDSSSPRLNPVINLRNLQTWKHRYDQLFKENVYLVTLIKKAHFTRGWVDCHWTTKPIPVYQYHQHRVDFLKRIHRENLVLYHRLKTTPPRVESTASLNRDWSRNKRKIVDQASGAFVLFPPIPCEDMEDQAFAAAPNVKRPRVYLNLGVQGGAALGEVCVELFTETCPNTCQLFLELLDGDTLGYGYVGTCFFRKVPHLYWSGGDVVYNNGYGCYAQRGRVMPIGAENYHYPHSMPGLLSMRVTVDDEMCGIFSITFKPLPQLDLRSVVFGRIIRPNSTYDIIRELGNALSSRPVVEIWSSRRKVEGRWISGAPNTRLAKTTSEWIRKSLKQ